MIWLQRGRSCFLFSNPFLDNKKAGGVVFSLQAYTDTCKHIFLKPSCNPTKLVSAKFMALIKMSFSSVPIHCWSIVCRQIIEVDVSTSEVCSVHLQQLAHLHQKYQEKNKTDIEQKHKHEYGQELECE